MFTELTVKNFQSLSEAKLKLGRINVIVGPSYLGKSAIVRAIHSITRNRFETNYMKQGTSSSKITLSEDDITVEYNRDSSSSYKWSGNPEPYTKIGRDVPQDIRNFLKMDEIIFDEDLTLDFNIQRQFDPAFIISLSGFEVAKVFGKLMNLDIVLTASRDISKDIQQLNKKKDECLAIQEVSINYIQQNCSIELKNALLYEAISLDSEADELDKKAEELINLIAELEVEEKKVEEYKKLVDFLNEQEIEKIEAPIQGFEDIVLGLILEEEKQKIYSELLALEIPEFDWEGFSSLETLIVDLSQVDSSILVFNSVLEELKEVDFDAISSLEALGSLISEGAVINSDFLNAKQAMESVNGEIKAKEEEFERYIQTNNICPITKMAFTETCLNNLKAGMMQ